MTFSHARPCRWCVYFTDDRIRNSEEKYMIFYKQKTLHEWMNKNTDLTITRMSIKYEYPSLDNCDRYV